MPLAVIVVGALLLLSTVSAPLGALGSAVCILVGVLMLLWGGEAYRLGVERRRAVARARRRARRRRGYVL